MLTSPHRGIHLQNLGFSVDVTGQGAMPAATRSLPREVRAGVGILFSGLRAITAISGADRTETKQTQAQPGQPPSRPDLGSWGLSEQNWRQLWSWPSP